MSLLLELDDARMIISFFSCQAIGMEKSLEKQEQMLLFKLLGPEHSI